MKQLLPPLRRGNMRDLPEFSGVEVGHSRERDLERGFMLNFGPRSSRPRRVVSMFLFVFLLLFLLFFLSKTASSPHLSGVGPAVRLAFRFSAAFASAGGEPIRWLDWVDTYLDPRSRTRDSPASAGTSLSPAWPGSSLPDEILSSRPL